MLSSCLENICDQYWGAFLTCGVITADDYLGARVVVRPNGLMKPGLVMSQLKFLVPARPLPWPVEGEVGRREAGDTLMETSHSQPTCPGRWQPMTGDVHSVNKNTLPLSRRAN